MSKRVTNTMHLVERARGCIDSRYSISSKNAVDIMQASREPYDLIMNGFRFGYMQGMKAARAEAKNQQSHGTEEFSC